MIPKEMDFFLSSLNGKKCWYASAGVGTGSSFCLAIGEKIPRKQPLKNSKQTEEYRLFEGEFSFLVWCSWRLDDLTKPITSSDEKSEVIEKSLETLINRAIKKVEVFSPVWDLHIEFSNHLTLKVFCDHTLNNPSFDGNWDLERKGKTLFAGAGNKWGIE